MADVTRLAWAYRKAGSRFDVGAFLAAFTEAVGPQGNVLVPAFNFDLRSGDAFDVRSTRSISGALANAAIDHPAFVRTSHPLHSFAVAGADAQRLTTTNNIGSFDEDSPFAFLLEKRATLIAVDLPLNDALTFVHFVEQRRKVSYRRPRELRIMHTDAEGRTQKRMYTLFAKKAGHVNSFDGLEAVLTREGACAATQVGGSSVLRIDLARAYDVIDKDIRTNGSRSIHRFDAKVWLADVVKSLLRTFGIRTSKDRMAHAARTS
jgi:aminoglycoside N3'-acetyltransferase